MFGSSNFSVKKLGALGAVLAIILMSCGGSSTSSNAGRAKNTKLADGTICYTEAERAEAIATAVPREYQAAVPFQAAVAAQEAVAKQDAVAGHPGYKKGDVIKAAIPAVTAQPEVKFQAATPGRPAIEGRREFWSWGGIIFVVNPGTMGPGWPFYGKPFEYFPAIQAQDAVPPTAEIPYQAPVEGREGIPAQIAAEDIPATEDQPAVPAKEAVPAQVEIQAVPEVMAATKDEVIAEINAVKSCDQSDVIADADGGTATETETTTPVLSVRLDQDEVLFLATVTSASTEDIVVSGCGISGESSNQTVGLITSFDAERQTADCTVTVTQGSLTATSDFTYSSQVVTQGGDGDNNNSNVEELPDFALDTPVFDGVNKWTVEILNRPMGYYLGAWTNSPCITQSFSPDGSSITAVAPDGCTAETFTLFMGANNGAGNADVVRSVQLSRTPTPIPTECETAPNVVGLVITTSCEEATGLFLKSGTDTRISAKEVNIGEPTPDVDIWNWCGDAVCGPSVHIGPTSTGDLDITCSAPTYEVNNDDAIVAITTGTCTGDDASLVTEMSVEVAQPCSSSNLLISCIIEGVDRSTLVLEMGTSERVQLQAGTIRLTSKYFGIQDDGEIIFVSDPFQHEIDFQRQCDPVVTADTVEYAKNVRGNIYFEFLSPCKGVTGNLFHFVVPMEDGSTVSLQVAWSPREDGTMLIVNDMGGKISADNAGKTFLAQYAWDGWGSSQTFEFTLPADWRKAKVADPLPTFEARSDDAGNIFGKLGELSAACANYAYNFRIESIDRVDDFKDGPIFDITSENKWASSLPNGVYRVWIYSEDSLNDETPCNAMDQEITVKQAEKPAEPPVIVVVNPIITLPRIDDTNKNDALIVESQVTTINCALNCYDDLISLTGQTEGELFVQVVGSDGETEWIQVDRTRSVNQIPINEKAQKLNVRVFDKQANTFVDGSINLNRIQSANATNVASGDSNSSNSTRNIIIILAVVLLCGYLAKTLVLDKRKNIQ